MWQWCKGSRLVSLCRLNLNTFRNTCTWVVLKLLLFYFCSSTFLVNILYFTEVVFLSVTKLLLDYTFWVVFAPLCLASLNRTTPINFFRIVIVLDWRIGSNSQDSASWTRWIDKFQGRFRYYQVATLSIICCQHETSCKSAFIATLDYN